MVTKNIEEIECVCYNTKYKERWSDKVFRSFWLRISREIAFLISLPLCR